MYEIINKNRGIEFVEVGYCVWCNELIGFVPVPDGFKWVHVATRDVVCGNGMSAACPTDVRL